MGDELKQYLKDLDIDTELYLDEYQTREEAFTAHILSEISELINVPEFVVRYGDNKDLAKRIRGAIHAYALSPNREVLTLVYTLYDSSSDGTVKTLVDADFQGALNKLQGFYNMSIRRLFMDLKEDDPLYEPSKIIYDELKTISTVRLLVLSNCTISKYEIKNNRIMGKATYADVWDLKKIYANLHSGMDHAEIVIDFENEFKFKIPYIEMKSDKFDYKCLIAMFPGKLLYRLYEKHNTDLLLNNVRYFLGFKGSKKSNANIGIQKTLREENQMFLAYNNGITAIASGFEATDIGEDTNVSDSEDHSSVSDYISTGIFKSIRDFRIVNGGQTTASIFFSKFRDPSISLLGVYVQVKIIILNDDVNAIAGNITKYSNSQSKVKYADFTISNAFNIEMERLSRNTIVPNANNDARYWFFERVRGQYDVERKRNTTKESLQYFNMMYPKELKFKKEEIAKIWKSWEQTPFDAVKGEGTNYDIYISDIVDRNFIPDENYFKKTIALLLIYRFLASRPENKDYKNKKAPVIAYTMAYLNYITANRIDLLKIWKNQGLTINMQVFLNQLAEQIKDALISASGGSDSVLSFSKRKDAFGLMIQERISCDRSLIQEEYEN